MHDRHPNIHRSSTRIASRLLSKSVCVIVIRRCSLYEEKKEERKKKKRRIDLVKHVNVSIYRVIIADSDRFFSRIAITPCGIGMDETSQPVVSAGNEIPR